MSLRPFALLACVFLNPPAAAGELSLSVGLDYSSGKYGSEDTTETWVMPLIAKYEVGRLMLKASLPYIHTSGPGDVVGIGPDRVPSADAAERRSSESGIGDLVLSAGYTLAQNRWLLLDLVGKVKLPTADEDRGLVTGETDFSAQLDAATVLRGVTIFGTLGKKAYGDPAGSDYRDPLYSSLGAGFRMVPSSFVGASYDWRDKVTRNGAQIRELTVFASHRPSPGWKLQAYLIRGLSDGSPEFGGGLIVTRSH